MSNKIISSLKRARSEAFAEIERINKAIDILEPKPKIVVGATADQYKSKFLKIIDNRPRTAREIRRKAGFVSESQTYKYLKELVEEDRIHLVDVNGIHHYVKPREELRLVAGDGVKSRRRRRAV